MDKNYLKSTISKKSKAHSLDKIKLSEKSTLEVKQNQKTKDNTDNKTIKEEINQITSLCNVENHSCPICLGLLYNPISTPCNHKMCSKCFEECIEFSIKTNSCPLCRSEIDKDFNPKVDKDYQLKIENIFPKEYKEKLKQIKEIELLDKQFIKLKFFYGNTHEIRPHPKKDGETTHYWKIYIRLASEKETRKYINYIELELHPTFPGNKTIKVKKYPFEFKSWGWGYFNLPIKIYFNTIINSEPIVIDHMLSFDGNGIDHVTIQKLKKKIITLKC